MDPFVDPALEPAPEGVLRFRPHREVRSSQKVRGNGLSVSPRGLEAPSKDRFQHRLLEPDTGLGNVEDENVLDRALGRHVRPERDLSRDRLSERLLGVDRRGVSF
jgi:hypothetical protein